MKHPLILPACLALLCFGACKDEPEQIPTYLNIQPFTVNAPGGAAAQEITEAWVYSGVDFLGAFTLPALVPVLPDSAELRLTFFPGVKEDGLLATPNIYPFFTRYEKTVAASPGNTVEVDPSTAYDPTAKQPWGERGDFDVSSVNLEDRDDDSGYAFELTTQEAFSGRSLRLAVDTVHPLVEIATESAPLPAGGAAQIWVELNYRSDQIFSLGLAGFTSGAEEQLIVYQFRASENWNKTYINLTDFVTTLNEENYRLLFHVSLPKDASGNYTQSSGRVLIDNLRLIHF